MSAVTLNPSSLPTQNAVSSYTITQHRLKIVVVALAALAFFAFQMGLSWPISLILSAAVVGLAMITERNENWFNTSFDASNMKFWATILLLKPVIMQIVCLALGIPLPPISQTGVAKMMLSQPWRIIPLATIIAPFTEEVLFRGVLLDFLKSLNLGEELSMWIQAAIFGAIHLRAAVEEGAEFMLFAMLSFTGYWFADERREADSLLSPMALHSANNISACVYIFLSEGTKT